LHVTASVGLSICPQDGADAQSLVKAADAAMYQAKTYGRNNYWFSRQEMNPGAAGRRSLPDLARLVRYVARLEHR
jgi:predicted signal transduction protein with EAL and GGDEF domain